MSSGSHKSKNLFFPESMKVFSSRKLCVIAEGMFHVVYESILQTSKVPYLSFSSLTVTLLSLILEKGILWIPSLLYVKIMLYLHLRHICFGPFPILNELVVSNECLKMDFMSNIE